MSVRSGVFTKYVIEFTTKAQETGLAAAAASALGAGGGTKTLKVSNDLLAADVCIDADVTISMLSGSLGTSFKITLYDLPEQMSRSLETTPISQALVSIKLGYFDTKTELVLDGIYEKVESEASAEKLVTTIKGREKAFYACAETAYSASLKDTVSFAKAAQSVLASVAANDKLPKDCVDLTPRISAALSSDAKELFNPSFHDRNGKVLGALEKIAVQAGAELRIIDKKVFIGSPIFYDAVAPASLEYGVNLAKFDSASLKIPGKIDPNGKEPKSGVEIKGFKFTALGDPLMRPGQKIAVRKIKDFGSPEFIIRKVDHTFSASAGYTCVGTATELPASGEAARNIDAAIENSAAAVATDISERIRSQAFENAVVEIAAVKAAGSAYRADLYYGQPAAPGETQPSVNLPVTQQDDHVYQDKPIASPFAWRKCGLVTPVYPGMKAVVAHNRALSSDGIITGYVWSKQPDFAPPSNQPGDWWLCLPMDFDASSPPADSTKAANDLTSNKGNRVIEVKGLRITIGSGKLGEVGKRPTEGADDEFLIEHASGTRVHIDTGGALTIDVSKGSLKIKGDVVIEGNLEIK